jgi:hypothetical protein
LVGGLFVALASLALSGFSFLDQVRPDIVPWHPWVITVVMPFAVGAAGTLWRADPIVGKRIARLAAITGGLGLYVYATIAVAVIGAGGPLDDEGRGTLQGTVSDRLGNNLVYLLLILMVTAMVGWAGAAAAGALTARLHPATIATSPPATTTAETAGPGDTVSRAPTHTPQPGGRAVFPPLVWRTGRLLLLSALVAGALLLAATSWRRG